jgi:hypothetical protein
MTSTEDLKETMPNYYWQIQGSLFVTGRKNWHFVSYDPRFKDAKHKLKMLYIKRNESDIKLLENRLLMAIDYRNALIEKFNANYY